MTQLRVKALLNDRMCVNVQRFDPQIYKSLNTY